MASGTHHGHAHHSTPRVRNGEPQPAPTPTTEPASAKRDLTSWWKQFSKRNVKKEDEKEPEVRGIFGVPLISSIPYANVAISLFNESGESYIYGYVPIVVAKCGVFLKERATDVEGIFRLAGSEKRIKELKTQFDTPPKWGKGLDWSGYTVHDAANILRRYFNQLPEPIIPLQYYENFRKPLRGHQAEAVGHIDGQAASVGGFDPNGAVQAYQQLIKELPSLNRQLLLYILDLLAVFAAKADINKMTTSNLAAIFQPGILSHPQHDMAPREYRLSQDVLIFLIDNQDHFLIGMEGTALDANTAKHIESGPSSPQATPSTPPRTMSGMVRSASTASSAGAESLRKTGGVRRNVSTSSRRSRQSGAVPSPVTPSFTPYSSGSGVHRSNTLPSKRSPGLTAARFPRERSDPPTPVGEDVSRQLPPPVSIAPAPAPATTTASTSVPLQVGAEQPQDPVQVISRAQTLPIGQLHHPDASPATEADSAKPGVTTPATESMPGGFPSTPGLVQPSSEILSMPAHTSTAPTDTLVPPPAHQPRHSPQSTPKHEKSEFMEAPLDTPPSPEPKSAVRSFTQILSKATASSDDTSPGRKPNKLQKKRIPSANPSAHSSTHSLTGPPTTHDAPPSPLPPSSIPASYAPASKDLQHVQAGDAASSRTSEATLKPNPSSTASNRSHSTATEYSEADIAEETPREEKRSFWKSHKRGDSKATPTASQTDLHGSLPGADKSMSSFASSSGWGGGGGRRSLQNDAHQPSDYVATITAGEGKEVKEHSDKKSPLDWFAKKRQEHKEKQEKKQRAKSPPGSTAELVTQQSLAKPLQQEDPSRRGRPEAERQEQRERTEGLPQGLERTAAPQQGQQPVPQQPSGPQQAREHMESVPQSSDITPTATSPQPSVVALPAARPTQEQAQPLGEDRAAPVPAKATEQQSTSPSAQQPQPVSEPAGTVSASAPISTTVAPSVPAAQSAAPSAAPKHDEASRSDVPVLDPPVNPLTNPPP